MDPPEESFDNYHESRTTINRNEHYLRELLMAGSLSFWVPLIHRFKLLGCLVWPVEFPVIAKHLTVA